ncbi:MAG: RNA-binding protein [Thermoprotei archaeon]|nr:MAG: RNA-binding protein [Thermoprotei archaeon]
MKKLGGALKELKKRKVAQHRADINIGKRGLDKAVVEEIKRRLDIEKAIKIRLLKSARAKVSEKDIENLAKEIGAIIADSRGYTFILIKTKKSNYRVKKVN